MNYLSKRLIMPFYHIDKITISMGIYNLSLGKGVIIPINMFIEMFNDYFKDKEETDVEFMEYVLKKETGKSYQVSVVGHDAFKSRGGNMDVLSETKNYDIVQDIKKLDKKYKKIDIDCCLVGCGTLIFIGFYESLGKGEFEYYPEASEIIYGLTSLLDDIVAFLPLLKEKDCTSLTKTFNQNSCIWTFAPDCACCG
uniref:Uncharacterized protein n=1 Tax=Pithovirus LCPAC101 TaxID=2506586 RepID=A0A481Z297_9VIRU|nr:MAG: hypothetical protein LCPAC101_01190 [Pithovirus LCPAC101]